MRTTFVPTAMVVNILNIILKSWGKKIFLRIFSSLFHLLPNLKLGNKISFKRHVVPFSLQSGCYLNYPQRNKNTHCWKTKQITTIKPKQNRNPKKKTNMFKNLSCSQPPVHMFKSIVSWSKKRCGTDGMLVGSLVKPIFC